MVMHYINVQLPPDEALPLDFKVRNWDADNAEKLLAYCNRLNRVNEPAEPSSACLRAMVDEFMEMELSSLQRSASARVNWCLTDCTGFCDGACSARGFDSSLAGCQCVPETAKEAVKELDSVLRAAAAGVDAKLATHVERATEEAKQQYSGGSEVQARVYAAARGLVVKHLKREGYNAGICKSEGKPVNGAPIDGHEYVDVIIDDGGGHLRLVVDLGFRWHFEIARPSPAYQQLVRMLPENFVGTSITLQRVVRVMCQAAKASLESHGMPVPPWRRPSFMHAKWCSPHSRISALEEDTQIPINLPPKHTLSSKTKVDIMGISKAQSAASTAAIPQEELSWQPPLVNLSSNRKIGSGFSSGALAMAIVEARMPKST